MIIGAVAIITAAIIAFQFTTRIKRKSDNPSASVLNWGLWVTTNGQSNEFHWLWIVIRAKVAIAGAVKGAII